MVAVYTLVGEERYRVILVTAQAHSSSGYPISSTELNKKVLAFREVLQDPQQNPKPLALELYKILIEPITQALAEAGAKTIMWSLDGTLRYLPVTALFDGEKYLVERYRSVLFTLASLNFLKDEPKSTWRAAGFGVSKAFERFDALPSVPGELAAIIREEGKGSGVLPGTVKLDEQVHRGRSSEQLALALPRGAHRESFLLHARERDELVPAPWRRPEQETHRGRHQGIQLCRVGSPDPLGMRYRHGIERGRARGGRSGDEGAETGSQGGHRDSLARRGRQHGTPDG